MLIDAIEQRCVSDVLAIIGAWGDCGDGTYRPTGDIAPMPNGDCCVTVADVLAVVGNWGADCSVYGSCCMSDGSCSEMTDMACMDAGGSWVEGGSMDRVHGEFTSLDDDLGRPLRLRVEHHFFGRSTGWLLSVPADYENVTGATLSKSPLPTQLSSE